MKRNQFVKIVSTSGLLFSSIPLLGLESSQNDPQLDKSLVQKFVGSSHGNFEVVKALLDEHPTLINAAHDWKYGDFETGLGAASHVGNKVIVNYLLDHGAQANIFTLALFGKLELLKPILDFSPGTLYAKGPHGYTLLHHANMGGDEALDVKDYLLSNGLEETQFKIY